MRVLLHNPHCNEYVSLIYKSCIDIYLPMWLLIFTSQMSKIDNRAPFWKCGQWDRGTVTTFVPYPVKYVIKSTLFPDCNRPCARQSASQHTKKMQRASSYSNSITYSPHSSYLLKPWWQVTRHDNKWILKLSTCFCSNLAVHKVLQTTIKYVRKFSFFRQPHMHAWRKSWWFRTRCFEYSKYNV